MERGEEGEFGQVLISGIALTSVNWWDCMGV